MLINPLMVTGDDSVLSVEQRQAVSDEDAAYETLATISRPQENSATPGKTTRYGMGYESRMKQLGSTKRPQNDQEELPE